MTKLFFFSKNVWWDSAVYIGMGKYIYSFGKSGLWEASRPLVWPLILGFTWKLKLDVVFYSKLIELLFSAGCVYFTYLIGKSIFNNKVAWLSAVFVAFSSTFFNYTAIALTEIPSLFIGLLAVYCFIKKRFFLAGIFSSLTFMTRFLQFGIFLVLIIFLLITYNRKDYLKGIFNFILGFILIFFPYLIFNYFSYNNFLYPFFLQVFLTKYTGWMYHQPFWFYFIGLFKENFLFVFSVIGIILIFKKRRYEHNLVLLIFSLFFIFFTFTKHKEMRFIITFLPYLSLTTAYGIYGLLKKIKNQNTQNIIFIIILFLFLLQSLSQFKIEEEIDYSFFYEQIDDGFKENIWITNPVYIANSDKKAELIYYPTFNLEKINGLKEKISNANLILINTCDIPCPPWDGACFNEKPIFIEGLKQRFKTIDYRKDGDCERIILGQ